MKSLFKGYYKLNKDEIELLWNNATFVFDTNVLLSLYRYQSSTCEFLLKVIEKLSDRIWIPYHVGLEFQRNRTVVISEQRKRYSEVKNIVDTSLKKIKNELDGLQLKKRHSHINPDELLNNIEITKQKFFDYLQKMQSSEESDVNITSNDRIRERIDKLFNGRVGAAPKDQEEIDNLQKEGESRYLYHIPPGYKDVSKSTDMCEEFTYSGIIYKSKFGDLIVWKQIIEYAKKNKLKDLIFVTDDNKSDWWWQVNANGTQTIGVRPELVDEITREANIERFTAYNTEKFSEYASKLLGTKVKKEAIEEIREVAVRRQTNQEKNIRSSEYDVEIAVYEWLSQNFEIIEEHNGFPDFIAHKNDRKYGFEVKLLRNEFEIFSLLKATIQSTFILKESNFSQIDIIIVAFDDEIIKKILPAIQEKVSTIAENIYIIIGKVVTDSQHSKLDFVPYKRLKGKM